MEAGSPNHAADLPDDLIVEILARLPAKSLRRFTCVSRSWRALIADPAHRARLAQTLSGFFVFSRPFAADARPSWGFVGLPLAPPPGAGGEGGLALVDTALSFLPASCGEVVRLLDSCNGLLLLLCSHAPRSPSPPRTFYYVVCNPATGEWVALPPPSHAPGQHGDPAGEDKRTSVAALGFDPAVSTSHFHVFQLLQEKHRTEYKIEAVEIYSSETHRWGLSKKSWSDNELLQFGGHMTYFNGVLHITVHGCRYKVVAVNTNGEPWRVKHVQSWKSYFHNYNFIGHSQGRLIYMDEEYPDDSLSIYVLQNHDSDKWTLKHNISTPDLFGPRESPWGPNYEILAVHPHCDLIFFYDRPRERLMSYDMARRETHVICTIERVCDVNRLFLPYVPLYSRVLMSPNVN
ncbi:hypothetical protein ACP70R_019982 [Stipagrostis hirtigluma subsp. patula]